MRIKESVKLDFDDVLIIPKRSKLAKRSKVKLERQYKFVNSAKTFEGIPIIASNMATVGTLNMSKALFKHKMFTTLHKFYSVQEIKNAELDPNSYAITVGETSNLLDYNNFIPQFFRLDAANGYREDFVSFLKHMRNAFPMTTIIAGNVCTPEMTEQLILSGADVVAVGIGSGGQCTTRLKTGIGYPQLSAISECADAAHGIGGHIVADGGIRIPGDICKAFAAGADFVMLGSMFAAHDENTDIMDIKQDLTGRYTYTYGMSSEMAREKHYSEKMAYRASEGKTSKIYMRGSIDETVQDILGSLRSCCTYVGAASLKELSKRTTFIRVNRQRNTFYDNVQAGD